MLFLQVGTNRAVASQDRLQLLNPTVDVTAESSRVEDKPEEFFKDFDVVLVTCRQKDALVRINGFCRNQGVKFFAGDIFGFFGYSFMDLIEHEYAVEEKVVEVSFTFEQS